jgi:hypothetical protein
VYLYHVQLETKTAIYTYEVYTSDFDAVAHARVHLATLIGPEQAALAHKGGCSKIGEGPDLERPQVTLTLQREL